MTGDEPIKQPPPIGDSIMEGGEPINSRDDSKKDSGEPIPLARPASSPLVRRA
ncbi:hypothetical protein [Jeotgalibacillus salarius]|uniref:hypothetical protein n=1 Tax=Jeotgalibacillus salarius TaxID=546023 RepID=UPI00141AB3C5|nr:hypothetical protein [Jeotgalibacillus salarius]